MKINKHYLAGLRIQLADKNVTEMAFFEPRKPSRSERFKKQKKSVCDPQLSWSFQTSNNSSPLRHFELGWDTFS